jgi:hypothetical protein
MSEWREFRLAAFLAENILDDNSRLDVEITHMNRPLFPTTLSILPYDIGNQVRLRTYKHPRIFVNRITIK